MSLAGMRFAGWRRNLHTQDRKRQRYHHHHHHGGRLTQGTMRQVDLPLHTG
jgi:hypothetical protein